MSKSDIEIEKKLKFTKACDAAYEVTKEWVQKTAQAKNIDLNIKLSHFPYTKDKAYGGPAVRLTIAINIPHELKHTRITDFPYKYIVDMEFCFIDSLCKIPKANGFHGFINFDWDTDYVIKTMRMCKHAKSLFLKEFKKHYD